MCLRPWITRPVPMHMVAWSRQKRTKGRNDKARHEYTDNREVSALLHTQSIRCEFILSTRLSPVPHLHHPPTHPHSSSAFCKKITYAHFIHFTLAIFSCSSTKTNRRSHVYSCVGSWNSDGSGKDRFVDRVYAFYKAQPSSTLFRALSLHLPKSTGSTVHTCMR